MRAFRLVLVLMTAPFALVAASRICVEFHQKDLARAFGVIGVACVGASALLVMHFDFFDKFCGGEAVHTPMASPPRNEAPRDGNGRD